MVQRMWSENKKSNTWLWPEPETTDFSGGKGPMKLEDIDEELPLHKRRKSSSSRTTNEWNLDSNEFPFPPYHFNPLNEPSPLGLRLKKSPSLLELIQTRLSQCNKNKGTLPSENLQVGNKKDVKARAGTSGPIDKLKASNFPALLIRIGQWEYASQHEGDLVAKCYFAKHKLVWEVLDGGLKNKIEIQWADIVALKANCPDNGPGTLTIVLGKKPLFFRETDPQPRKHTLWQATSDFTNGEATRYRQHYLQCAQGVLNKHYEKLIQCDTRLNFLSQQLDTVLDLPFASIKDPGNNVVNRPEMSEGSSVSGIKGMVMPSASQHWYLKTKELGTLVLPHGDFAEDTPSPNSVSIHGFEENGFGGSCALQGPKTFSAQIKTPRLQQTMSISDLVNHIGHCISEPKSAGILPLLENVSAGGNQKDALENISQILLSDTQLTTASDEKSLLSRVDSLSSLLQDSSSVQNHVHDGNDSFTPDCHPTTEIGLKQGWEEEYGNASDIMSGKDSFSELLHELPGIASLQRLLFDISKDGEILNP
ncbi:uncharacterized protein LOC112517187 isoform X2 [Cynara cardunculus var. scolymus]|uniref:uncharacterized protein LOC112517187 isoform X2 n=1 Tax=Cynara cardunculus var. scolymus TaxID=59895 RepID=UPI000D6258C4|nr:uncharacterized protein LOC112517187 isoform X2 [Cynara cardunculus var. scolymus]